MTLQAFYASCSGLTSLLCLILDDNTFYQGFQAVTVEHNAVPADEEDDEVLYYDNYTERLELKGRGRKRGTNIHRC